jgi:hypothetical protein
VALDTVCGGAVSAGQRSARPSHPFLHTRVSFRSVVGIGVKVGVGVNAQLADAKAQSHAASLESDQRDRDLMRIPIAITFFRAYSIDEPVILSLLLKPF